MRPLDPSKLRTCVGARVFGVASAKVNGPLRLTALGML